MDPDHDEEASPQSPAPEDDDDNDPDPTAVRPSFPLGRIKKIVKLDRDIKKLNSEALLLITLSAELFLGLLAERSRDAAAKAKKRAIKVDHLTSAVRAHQATSDFLLDCLPKPPQPHRKEKAPAGPAAKAAPPPGARTIDEFFSKAQPADAEV